ncbi:4-hydroxyphenylpyruvate dioxygenase [Streptomyces sp. NPDC088253]|uniref:4-hydroxyphenylpyruvate dioxygenase n=1 Tax=Streptomyces sp. NPDC088253 TaxID=3365846 RepID=UPI0037F1D769
MTEAREDFFDDMTTDDDSSFDAMSVDHVELYVSSLAASTDWLVDQYGFTVTADNAGEAARIGARSTVLDQGRIRIVLTEGLDETHPASVYVARHGDGVGNIALGVSDVAAAFAAAVRRGARPVAEPQGRDGAVSATIVGFGDVHHTFVRRRDENAEEPGGLSGLSPVAGRTPAVDPRLTAVDHFAGCLEAGTLDATVDHYVRVLGFSMIFAEDIVVGTQAMISKVVQSASGAVTLTLIEPDTTREPGQIDSFLKNHGGAGVQHVAFNTDDVIRSVGLMKEAGVGFLDTPDTYYQLLARRVAVRRHSVDELREHDVLMDEDHDGQLFQIFTRSVHPRRTLFMEVIERSGARTFGSNNIKALYEAVELQRAASGTLT